MATFLKTEVAAVDNPSYEPDDSVEKSSNGNTHVGDSQIYPTAPDHAFRAEPFEIDEENLYSRDKFTVSSRWQWKRILFIVVLLLLLAAIAVGIYFAVVTVDGKDVSTTADKHGGKLTPAKSTATSAISTTMSSGTTIPVTRSSSVVNTTTTLNETIHENVTSLPEVNATATPFFSFNSTIYDATMSFKNGTDSYNTTRPTLPQTTATTLIEAPVRLVDDSVPYKGRIEIFYNGAWGTVCNYGLGTTEAIVICRQLGYGNFSEFLYNVTRQVNGSSTNINTTRWLANIHCEGTEEFLSHCTHNGWGNTTLCTGNTDAGIECVEQERSTSTPNVTLDLTTSGILQNVSVSSSTELSNNTFEFTTLLPNENNTWKSENETIGTGYETSTRSTYVQNITAEYDNVTMSSNYSETTVLPPSCPSGVWCPSQRFCLHQQFVCDGFSDCFNGEDESDCHIQTTPAPYIEARLTGGINEGRLEVLYNDIWGTVCDDNFDIDDATVACRMLGFGVHSQIISNTFGEGSGEIWLSKLECEGNETSLAECRHNGWGEHICGHYEDIAIACYNETDASLTSTVPSATTQVPMSSTFLQQITTTEPEPDSIRLVGDVQHQGRLEIYHSGEWGTVCDDGFDLNDAKVACRMLGYSGEFTAIMETEDGSWGQIVWMSNLDCIGNESSLAECPRDDWGGNWCFHWEDIGISCTQIATTPSAQCDESSNFLCPDGYCLKKYLACDHIPHCETGEDEQNCTFPDVQLRLVGYADPAHGVVEVLYNGTWGTVCNDLFGIEDATVMCRMLGYNDTSQISFESPTTNSQPHTNLHMWMDDLQCTGQETSVSECPHKGWGESFARTHNCDPATEYIELTCAYNTSDVSITDGTLLMTTTENP